MSTFLFSSQPGTGHLNPLLTIARQMQARGHTAVFANFAPPKAKKLIEGHGFRLINTRPPLGSIGLTLLPNTTGFTETALAMYLFYAGVLHNARATIPVLEEVQPAAVVSDFSYLGSCLAAETRGIPYGLVYHAGLSFPGPGIPPFGSGLPIGETESRAANRYRRASDLLARSLSRRIARARTRLGLPPGETRPLTHPASPWLNMVLTSEASEAPRAPLPANTFFIGPCFAGRGDSGDSPFGSAQGKLFDQLSPDKPKIYVSLGTVFNRKPRVFQNIIRAFEDGRCQLIVSAGGAYDRLRAGTLPPNVLLFPRVPQVALLPHVDAVISHGGNNTTNETLAAGKPLLVMPVGGEQGDNASRVVHLGAGLRADIKQFTPQEIGAKIDRLLAEPSFRQRAQAIASALAQTDGPATAAQFIERVAQTGQPLTRPAGYPLTVTRAAGMPWE